METKKSKEQTPSISFDEAPQQAARPPQKAAPIVTFDEAQKASIEYFKGDEMAAKVWVSKYALKDSFGNIYERTPDDMHWRIAREIARVEGKYANPMTAEQIHDVLADFRYIVPQGGPMTGIGNQYQIASLSNCFVIGEQGNADSYGGIMKVDEEQVQLMKRRGGVGHDLSHIRPKGSPVLNSALTSTGIVPFMERFSNSTREVAQDGRRGALMLSISIKHPDSESFIDAKMTAGKVTGANVSVKIDDEFMRCAQSGKPYVQQYPIDAKTPKYRKEVNAAELWKKIIHNAWKSAEPGVLFWDTILRESVPDCYADLGYRTVSTNPCGEIPLCPYDSCRLLAINLYSYVENPFTPQARFNFDLFRQHVHIAQRMMDDIIDLEAEKIDAIIAKIKSDPESDEIKAVEHTLWLKIKEKTLKGRRTGIGITAEGDMLAAMNLQYGTDQATQFAVEVQRTLAVEAYRSSMLLGKERGAFPIYDAQREKDNPFINRLKQADPALYEEMAKHGRRNIALLTIAPTGTTSLMTQTTSGIEPVFLPVYKRRRKVNPNDKNVKVSFRDQTGDAFEEFNVFHHKFLVWAEANGHKPEQVAQYTDEQVQELVRQSPYHGATSNDVDWVNKVRMQGMIQQWVDHSISVTVNLPNSISEETVAKVYETAWESGCKGCTVYRDGSRDGVLVALTPQSDRKDAFPSKRPPVLECDVLRFKNNSEDWIAFVGLFDGRPYEIFTGLTDQEVLPIPKSVTKGKIIKIKDKSGSRYDFQYIDKYGYTNTLGGLSHMFQQEFWNYAKLISSVLRYGMPIPDVVNLVASLKFDSDTINTWKAGVERALHRYIPNGTKAKAGKKCPECGQESLVYSEGCLICTNCGHSRCG